MEHGLAQPPAWLMALETSGLAQTLRSSLWLYPTVETLHILGFALLVGAIVAFDLRLVAAAEGLNVESWVRRLVPVAATGLALAMAMGALLFTVEATAYARNPLFLAKMTLLVLALANVAWFHLGPLRLRRMVGPSVGIPRAMRLSAGLSIAGWVAVLVCGRLIAYV